MQILTLGSCRVHDPVVATARRGEIEDVNRLFGPGDRIYVHAPNEIMQFCRIITGEVSLSPDMAKYVYQQSSSPLSPALRPHYDRAEAVVVEICTNKEFSAGGVAMNINEISRQTINVGGPATRAWWNEVARGQCTDAGMIAAAIDELKRAGREVGAADEFVLRELKCQRLAPEEMKRKVAEVVELIGRPMLLVPHIRVRTVTGEWFEGRNVHVTMLLDIARSLNLPVLDPHTFVERNGQAVVLADEGRDFNHYAKSYIETVGEAIREAVMALPVRDAQAAAPREITLRFAAQG